MYTLDIPCKFRRLLDSKNPFSLLFWLLTRIMHFITICGYFIPFLQVKRIWEWLIMLFPGLPMRIGLETLWLRTLQIQVFSKNITYQEHDDQNPSQFQSPRTQHLLISCSEYRNSGMRGWNGYRKPLQPKNNTKSTIILFKNISVIEYLKSMCEIIST